ncbi:hypothetical protein [Phenylobacterium sp.]|uniref:hypothetical protein n=1 Tax=Phenylobacterium sp. TaxID=1871053 RepID=UPI00356794F1
MRISLLGQAALIALLATAGVSHAAPYRDGHCQIDAPADWVKSKTRIARADKKMWASLLEAPTAAEIVNMEVGLKAVKVSEDARQVVLVSTASYGGLTNKLYHVVSKTSPACVADVAAPAGPDEALAKKIGQTVTAVK